MQRQSPNHGGLGGQSQGWDLGSPQRGMAVGLEWPPGVCMRAMGVPAGGSLIRGVILLLLAGGLGLAHTIAGGSGDRKQCRGCPVGWAQAGLPVTVRSCKIGAGVGGGLDASSACLACLRSPKRPGSDPVTMALTRGPSSLCYFRPC